MDVARAGRKLSQVPGSLTTLYAVTGPDPDQHPCIGLVASPEIAAAIVDALNTTGQPLPAARLAPGRPDDGPT